MWPSLVPRPLSFTGRKRPGYKEARGAWPCIITINNRKIYNYIVIMLKILVYMYVCMYDYSIHFQISVNVANKIERGEERNSPQHEEEDMTGQQCVPKELYCL